MFDIERWQEIFSSIKNNKLRVILSGSTVALGLYIFIVLLGIGVGLQNNFTNSFNGNASNLIEILASRTEKAYAGMQAERHIFLHNNDYQTITKNYANDLEYSAAFITRPATVKYGKESGSYPIYGTTPDEQYIENRKIISGRYINNTDAENKRRVAVIGKMVQRDLIKDGNAIGKYISLNGEMFRVIGVFSDSDGDRAERKISVPINVLQQIKKNTDTLDKVIVAYKPDLSLNEAIKIGEEIENTLKRKYKISPEDRGGIRVYNDANGKEEQKSFMRVLAIIVGVIGLGTLIAGVISISNIMVYTVKERTKEIGIRKAIGAKPFSIILLILQESVIITMFSGLVGIALGTLTLKLMGDNLKKYFILNPSVDWNTIIFAFICLIIAGTFAGFLPAYKASKIKPIQALQQE